VLRVRQFVIGLGVFFVVMALGVAAANAEDPRFLPTPNASGSSRGHHRTCG
jgi:hypothetical protein